jgi:hypothetical protein
MIVFVTDWQKAPRNLLLVRARAWPVSYDLLRWVIYEDVNSEKRRLAPLVVVVMHNDQSQGDDKL